MVFSWGFLVSWDEMNREASRQRNGERGQGGPEVSEGDPHEHAALPTHHQVGA